ncbi:ubiquilin-1-like [Varanus komodoensis]|uniref:ubiquilin-1-like n=1 Tax=Varanus komodoensis TaxID=61221 RepID=UPI001CF7AD1F|nr:ubiquilin-1-like [Varanus komodoensis]
MVESQKIPGAKLAAAPEPQVVRILVKTPWQQEEFLVHRDMLVREFKELVARHFSAAPKHVVLVQAGRILKDHKALGHHGALLEADATVYVVVRSPWARPSRQASAGPPGGAPGQKPSQSSTSAGDGLRALTASLGLNTATFAEFQSRLMSHPDIMLRLLEDPSIQSKLSSPSLVKELLTNSRPVQQVIKSAPEISHVFSSPEGVRLVMELARNPAAVREILKSPPQALGCPSGDGNSVLQDTLAEARAPGQNAVPKWRGAAPWPVSLGGHQPPVEPEERPGWAREPLPSLRTWPTRPGALGEHSSGESGPWKGAEAGQLASAAVRNLLRQIIRHLVQSTMGSPSRNAAAQGPSPVPEQVARGARRDTGRGRDAREQAGTPVPGPDVLPASWSPRERQALLDIQRRLQALATEEPAGERRGRSERPARRARSITSLCNLSLAASGLGCQDLSAQQILQTLMGPDFLASEKGTGRPRGSSAQPSSKQKRTREL